jgi:hypothetical protein
MKNILKLPLGRVPLFVIIPVALIAFFAAKHHDLSNDMIGGLAAMMVAGYMLRETFEFNAFCSYGHTTGRRCNESYLNFLDALYVKPELSSRSECLFR